MASYLLNQELVKLLEKEGFGKREFARKTGLSSSYIANVTNEKRSFDSKAFLKILMKGFDMTKTEAKEFLAPLVQKKALDELNQL